MEKKYSPLAGLTVYFSGILIYTLHINTLNPTLFILSLLFFFSYAFYSIKNAPKTTFILAPFAFGIAVYTINIFYWDRFDFSVRVNNLLFISLICSLYLFIKEYQIPGKIVKIFNSQSLKKRLILIFIIFEIIFIISAVIITEKDIQFTGDEPHYLVISQSLAKDFDLNVANQYDQKQYREFLDAKKLDYHGYEGKKGRTHIFSIHLPGVSLTLSPLLLLNLKGKAFIILVRAYLGLFAALLAVFIYLISLKIWAKKSLSLFIVCVFSFTTPIFFLSTHIYPEIQVLLIVMSAIYLLIFSRNRQKILHILGAGFLLGLLLFWGVKYAIYMYCFASGFFIYYLRKKSYQKAFSIILFPVLFQGLFWTYLYSAYGNFSQLSVYMNESQRADFLNVLINKISLQMRMEALADFFFDQRDGLLLYNPFYLIALPGFILALSKWKKYKTHIMIAVPGILFFLSYALMTHRGGYCPQARPLAPAIWLFMMFGIIYYIEGKNKLIKRIFYKIPLYSFFIIIFQIFHPLSIYQTTTGDNINRAGLLFQELSNFYINLPKLLPSFIKVEGNESYLPNLIFIFGFLLIIIFSLFRIKKKGLKGGKLLILLAVYTLFVFLPQTPHFNPIFISRKNIIPHKLYGTSLYPQKKLFREFELKKQKERVFTLSAFYPAEYFIFRFNNNKNVALIIDIFNFNNLVKNLTIPALGTETVVVKVNSSKKISHQHYYRFKVEVQNPAPEIDCILEFFPTKKINIKKNQ